MLASDVAGRLGGMPAVRAVAAILGGLRPRGRRARRRRARLRGAHRPAAGAAAGALGLRPGREGPGHPGPAGHRDRHGLPAAGAASPGPRSSRCRPARSPAGSSRSSACCGRSSRFYSALDYAMSRIFVQEKSRDEIRRTLRGLLLATLLVALPIAIVFAGVAAPVAARPATRHRADGDRSRRIVVQLATPIGSFLVFVVATVMVYRYVPAERVPAAAWRTAGDRRGPAPGRVHAGVRVPRPADAADRGALRRDRRGVRAAGLAGDRVQHAADRRRMDATCGRVALSQPAPAADEGAAGS